ncbi:hypothetical protein LTR05_007765 [Lithohypha guttulata]|uniref:ATP-grasp domain-containing protein n=1 Tax=Lithohypha guttulata TaxID=1690604 RepID=A0AAN7SU67_9EURO|nr:hypothetical protein LTR05_007765 [Lithohypha guttulata]
MSATRNKVAVLYQAIEPPIVNGVRKPKKPGGYQDSGADIAYVLQQAGIDTATPAFDPDPQRDTDWCFADTEEGIIDAVNRGTTHLWANTILFSSHPLQVSSKLSEHASHIRVVGQPPRLVDQYDDKNFVNELLRRDGSFYLSKSWLVRSIDDLDTQDLPFPIVAKPIRGRGSHGVKLCRNRDSLRVHLEGLLKESSPAMLEQYLSGQEGTVTVMPPSGEHPNYTALPIVIRFNHDEGIAPYNGTVAVTTNSRGLTTEERGASPAYEAVEKACERVAAKLKVTAPIRIDVRQPDEDKAADFAIFDVNMKPNVTGPGRPGREDQASLTALAAKELGWDYSKLLQEILKSAQTLKQLRQQNIQ